MVTLSSYALLFLFIAKYLTIPRINSEKQQLGKSRWSTEKEQRDFFGSTKADMNDRLETAGSPVNYFPETNELLYEQEAVHDMWIGTTRSGKFRKILFPLIMLIIKAGESAIFNDPKKELYLWFRDLMKDKYGYKVYTLDFRNMKYSDHLNPMDYINYLIKKGYIDDADSVASDMVTSFVEDNGAGEKIWIDGQRALFKSMILAVATAPIEKEKKNLYSVFQTIAVQGKSVPVDGTEQMKISYYIDTLEESHIARTAFAPIVVSPEKTRGSFATSMMATLSVFNSKALARVLSYSDFDWEEFAEGKAALFIVNPDEKETYDRVTSLILQQAYQKLVFLANQMDDQHLRKKCHMVFDEKGSMPKLNNFQKNIVVALSRWIVYHMFLQDFALLEEKYGEHVTRTILGNVNLKGFISTGDYDTAKKVSEYIGNETVIIDGSNISFDGNASASGGSFSAGKQNYSLLDANELMSQDVRDGEGLVIMRTYMHPSKVYLPDLSKYSWSKNIQKGVQEPEKPEKPLAWAIPRFVVFNDKTVSALINNRDTDLEMQKGLRSKDMYWYWSMRDDSEMRTMVIALLFDYAKKNDLICEKEIPKKFLAYAPEEKSYGLIDGADEILKSFTQSEEWHKAIQEADYSNEQSKEVNEKTEKDLGNTIQNLRKRLIVNRLKTKEVQEV